MSSMPIQPPVATMPTMHTGPARLSTHLYKANALGSIQACDVTRELVGEVKLAHVHLPEGQGGRVQNRGRVGVIGRLMLGLGFGLGFGFGVVIGRDRDRSRS